jgi:hypothetical protein
MRILQHEAETMDEGGTINRAGMDQVREILAFHDTDIFPSQRRSNRSQKAFAWRARMGVFKILKPIAFKEESRSDECDRRRGQIPIFQYDSHLRSFLMEFLRSTGLEPR